MRRFHFPDVAAAVVLGAIAGCAIAVVAPAAPVSAESRAERMCINHGVTPNSAAYEQCVSRVTRAFEWGEPEMAYSLARISRDAKTTCLGYGLQPQARGFQACVDNEIDARSLLVFTDDQQHKTDWSPSIASQ